MKLHKFLAHAGIASRRKAEELIQAGRVTVNGQRAKIGQRVDPTKDKIHLDGQAIDSLPPLTYIKLYKPVGYLSTTRDPQGRKTILDLLPPELQTTRLYPVGRLDLDSEGLMLLTNDGDYAYQLTHPKFKVLKTYRVTIKGSLSKLDQQKLQRGFWLDRRFKTSPARLNLIQEGQRHSVWDITIHEGKKRQVRRMFAAIHHPVQRLIRTQLGPYSLDNLKPGEWQQVEKLPFSTH